MVKRSSKSKRDVAQNALRVVEIATGAPLKSKKNPAAVALGKLGGKVSPLPNFGGLRHPLTIGYTDSGMFDDALSALQFAFARVLAAFSRVPAPLSGGAAFLSASQSLR
jgi:hypothetical protein